MKILNWIKNLFKKESPKSEAPSKPNPSETPDSSNSSETPSSPKKFKIALSRGHGNIGSGSDGNGIDEVEYVTWVMKDLERRNIPNVTYHYGSNSAAAMLKAIATFPDLILQMHVNSADSKEAWGTEALVVDGDIKSYKYGEEWCANLNKRFKRKTRREKTKGLKILDSDDRGVSSLRLAKLCPKIITEPFFLSNKSDIISKEEYADFMEWQLREWQR